MSKKRVFYIVFFVVLILGFYAALSAIIPGFNEKKVPPISYVRPFSFTDQYGKAFTNQNVAGKVYVVEYFFTTCKGICPRMNNNMKKVFDRFKGEKDFLILSHTCDPEIDSVPVLKRYSDSIGATSTNWIFLTGRKDSLYNMARVSYAIDDPQDKLADNTAFLHTQYWAVVNKKGEVVKIYDGLEQNAVTELMEEVEKLLKD